MNTTSYTEDEKSALRPAHALWELYRPENAPYRFAAKTSDQACTWQETTRQYLRAQIGFQNGNWTNSNPLDAGLPDAPLQPKLLETVDKGDYTREKILLHTSPWTVMPVYILVPKGSQGPLPVVLALHGHGYGVKDIVGLWEDGAERDSPEGYHKDFAVALCRRGFLVAAPEISCFGERQGDFSYLDQQFGQDVPSTCHHTATLAFHLGGSALGLRVHDGQRLVDYLQTRPDVDINRLGAMGLSGGGMHTFFSTCLDTRIRACVVSGYFCPFKNSIFGMHHCTCNFVPGLHRFGEIYDLAGLIAPRPMLIEAGSRDPIFPIDNVKEAVAQARQVYGVFGAQNAIETDYFEGRHQISGARAYDFLWEKLA
jgi:dienelactone hydrolase